MQAQLKKLDLFDDRPKYVCLTRDVPNGGFKTIDLFGHPLLLTWKSDAVANQIHVDSNLCRHRSTRVVLEESGQGTQFRCPYHGLKHQISGKYDVAEVGEFLFIGKLPETFLKDFVDVSTDLGEQFHKSVMEVDCPFHLWMQNTADPNHLDSVHSEGFAEQFQRPALPYDVRISVDNVVSSYQIEVERKVVENFANLTNRKFEEMPDGFWHAIVAPHLSVTRFLDIFYSVETAVPHGEGCLVTTRFFSSRKHPLPSILISRARKANMQILKEDKQICELWAGTYDKSDHDFVLKGEERIQSYLRAIT